MTLLPVDALVATLPRAEAVSSEPAARPEPVRTVSPTLPARQPRLVPATATTSGGLALPTASGVNIAAARRLKALQDIAQAAQRDMGEAYQAVAGHFEAEIADARAQIESI